MIDGPIMANPYIRLLIMVETSGYIGVAPSTGGAEESHTTSVCFEGIVLVL